MVTHYDRGECDCAKCGNICHVSELVTVEWFKYAVCQRCVERHKEKEKLILEN